MSKVKLFSEVDAVQAGWMRRLVYANPFSAEREQANRALLGSGYKGAGDLPGQVSGNSPLLVLLVEKAERLAAAARQRLVEHGVGGFDPEDLDRYVHVVYVILFHRFAADFDRMIKLAHRRGKCPGLDGLDRKFFSTLSHYSAVHGGNRLNIDPAQVFALSFQLRRAFYHIFSTIIGSSQAANQLRDRVWDSIFTHRAERYHRTLFQRMGDIATLVTGPSGSGKELVARGIGLSQYIPFDERSGAFAEDFIEGFYPINLSALSPTLIESELFGHRKGAFTGALGDREGYFESCGRWGSVFLDEVGETGADVQVKLLRVLQTRTFQRLGDTRAIAFRGKVIAATNRDLVREIREGRFREDFFFRLCADQIETPGLRDILQDDHEQLSDLVLFIAGRIAGLSEAESVTEETMAVIRKRLGPDYAWPGNFRELEQCVRNVIVSGDYRPPMNAVKPLAVGESAAVRGFSEGHLNHTELLRAYFAIVYKRKGGSLEAAARHLGVDRRTVKKYLVESGSQ